MCVLTNHWHYRVKVITYHILLIIRSEKLSVLHVFTFIPEKIQLLVFTCKNLSKNFHGCKSNPWKRENFSPWMISNIRYITATISNKILHSYYFILYIRGFKVKAQLIQSRGPERDGSAALCILLYDSFMIMVPLRWHKPSIIKWWRGSSPSLHWLFNKSIQIFYGQRVL